MRAAVWIAGVADVNGGTGVEHKGVGGSLVLNLEAGGRRCVEVEVKRLQFHAQKVFLVLGGKGTVQALVNGLPERTVRVTADRLYTLVDGTRARDALLELRFSPGVEAYAFTFG